MPKPPNDPIEFRRTRMRYRSKTAPANALRRLSQNQPLLLPRGFSYGNAAADGYIYLFHQSKPQIRSLEYANCNYRIATPWVGSVITLHRHAINSIRRVSCFFSNTQITSLDQPLFYNCLPNSARGQICLGNRGTAGGTWQQVAGNVITELWGSHFNYDYPYDLRNGPFGRHQSPLQYWAEKTKKNPASILRQKWNPAYMVSNTQITRLTLRYLLRPEDFVPPLNQARLQQVVFMYGKPTRLE